MGHSWLETYRRGGKSSRDRPQVNRREGPSTLRCLYPCPQQHSTGRRVNLVRRPNRGLSADGQVGLRPGPRIVKGRLSEATTESTKTSLLERARHAGSPPQPCGYACTCRFDYLAHIIRRR